jgi:ribose 5-phosphate isomerase RpiB
LRFTTVESAKGIIDAWLEADFNEEGLNQARKLDAW